MSTTDKRPEVLVGEKPPPDLLDHTLWARRAVVGNLEAVHDTLTRLVTLSAGLLGGAAALLGSLPVAPAVRVIVVVLFLGSLGSSLWGSLPWAVTVDPAFPLEVRALRQRLAQAGMWCVRIACGCIFCGFAVLVGGLWAAWK